LDKLATPSPTLSRLTTMPLIRSTQTTVSFSRKRFVTCLQIILGLGEMNRIAICYGSRYGTTTEIVQEMARTAEEAGAEVDVIDLRHQVFPTPEVNYDLYVVGSGIQAGRWTKQPRKFLEKLAGSSSRVAIFVVCGDAGDPDRCSIAQTEYLDNIAAQYPGLSLVSTGLFGGMFDFKRYNFIVRALVKRIVKSRLPEGEELPEAMDFRDWDQIRGWITGLVSI
jgi:menaquinone-dependent protoporphyrinogen oxidase